MSDYKMHPGGLFQTIPAENGKAAHDIKLSAPFTTPARVSDTRTKNGFGLLVRFDDDRGRAKQTIVRGSSLHSRSGQSEICGVLEDMGLRIVPATWENFVAYLTQQMGTVPLADTTTITGWVRSAEGSAVYVLPDEIIGTQPEQCPVYYAGGNGDHNYQISGSTEDWQREVGELCRGNSRLIFAVCHPFAGALLRFVNGESGGSHLHDRSSIGKTTAQLAAGSVLGGGTEKGFLRSWSHTANAIEGAAALHNDAALILDELSLIDPKSAVQAVYTLANSQGKGRLNHDISMRKSQQWRVMVLSSGEVGLAEHAGTRTKAGAEIRLLDIEADAGAPDPDQPGKTMGLFEDLHGSKSGKEFSSRLQAAALTYYGAPFRAFVRALCTLDPAARLETIREHQQAFERNYKGLSPEVGRACSRMSLLAAAGEMASEFGITGWSLGEATAAVRCCFDAWMLSRGGKASAHDVREGLRVVKGYIERHPAEFELIGGGRVSAISASGSTAPMRDRIGFKRLAPMDKGEQTGEYLFLAESFRDTVLHGFKYMAVVKALFDAGYLRKEDGWRVQIRLGKERHWTYCVLGKLLDFDAHGENQ